MQGCSCISILKFGRLRLIKSIKRCCRQWLCRKIFLDLACKKDLDQRSFIRWVPEYDMLFHTSENEQTEWKMVIWFKSCFYYLDTILHEVSHVLVEFQNQLLIWRS